MLNAFHQLKEKVKSESSKTYRARGILVERCSDCQITPVHCICGKQPNLKSNVDFILIYHRDEVFKPTNTGRLIADTFPQGTYAFCWDRKEPPTQLLQLLKEPDRECVIIFPADDSQQREVFSANTSATDKKLTFILLDGSWRQGRRMFNFSQWLKEFSIIKLNPEEKTLYTTRKAACDSYLSTAESAALALATVGESESAKALFEYFALFDKHYQAMKQNLPVQQY
ncbi:tRNA-uridine aminocarboxypropyltransferase [Pleionea sp. CnH1-48]|uniref:tRNA-uridine aminocarboxypropyltransferase n=1 Tax=Pleionea sp. CnH1-48 TaxID=2954494 RepID=UPI002096BD60|nr:DTW domain-containing protein [Pleionea sp. CnH1-48]MCO7224754.1 DTW domain-containing protein [Pleionea sp. CnH1-48]